MKKKKDLMENALHGLFLFCGFVSVAFVLLISVYLIISGIPAIHKIGPIKFLFGTTWKSGQNQFGILPHGDLVPRIPAGCKERRGGSGHSGRGQGTGRGHGDYHGCRKRGEHAGAVPIRSVPDHRHRFGNVLRVLWIAAETGPVLHRIGAVPVHHDD